MPSRKPSPWTPQTPGPKVSYYPFNFNFNLISSFFFFFFCFMLLNLVTTLVLLIFIAMHCYFAFKCPYPSSNRRIFSRIPSVPQGILIGPSYCKLWVGLRKP